MPIIGQTSIRDVAARAGVSRGTVSKVLNASTGAQIAPSTRERVRRAAAELGYHPSAVARGLAGKRINTVGIVFAQGNTFFATSPYFAAILDGILEVAMLREQNTTLFTGQIWSDARHSLPIFRDGRSDGLLLLSPPPGSDIIPALLAAEVPFVLVGDQHRDPRVSSVDVDNIASARALVTHLLEQGHRRVAMLCGVASVDSVGQRLQGYRQALEARGIAYDDSLVLPGTYLEPSGYERTQALLERPAKKRPTALFCGNDLIALGALRALEERGVDVPEAVSVAGFDDIPAAATSRPPLTTMRQPMHQLGVKAMEMLLGQIHDGQSAGERHLLPTELIVRNSAAPPSGSGSLGVT